MAKLDIVCGNILDFLGNKDLIINSANKYMSYGSGVCGAIYNKANKKLLENYCKENFKEYMKVNDIRFTPGFDLGIDILHINCPKFYEYEDHRIAIEELLNSYYKIILETKKYNYSKIVSVSLGTGINGYKHNDIAKILIERLDYLVSKYNIEFVLVLPNEEIKNLYLINKSDFKAI